MSSPKGRASGSGGLIVSVTESGENQARDRVKGIFLLFERGTRPSADAVRQFVDGNPFTSLILDPANRANLHVVQSDDTPSTIAAARAEALARHGDWVELLRDGLSFDLDGISPGEGRPFPDPENSFDYKDSVPRSQLEAVRLVPGLHLAGGEGSLPVLRGMLSLARDLVQHFEQVKAVIWPPSSSVIGRRFFESTTTAWLEGGAFPALGLTAFRETVDGGLQSVGLNFLIGQELWIEPALAGEKVAATRLGVRLINQLVLTGPVEHAEQVIGPDGSRLRIEPSSNGKFIRLRSN